MTIVLSGGGTGGHITPILAVALELKRQAPDCRIIYIGERGGKFQELTANHPAIDQVYTIFAGKFRRYHSQSLLRHLLDVKTNLLNLRDLLYFAVGVVQAWRLLGKLKPEVVFLKGGFVGVPVGLAAVLRHRPFVTHDSDVVPGLANRLVGRWAAYHAVALPPESYGYPLANTVQVGVIVQSDFHPVTPLQQATLKQSIGVSPEAELLLITGASSGAVRLNQAVVKIIDKLLQDFPNLSVIHQVGKGKTDAYGDYHHERLQVLEFMRPMSSYTGAADVVVARAGANSIAELGVQQKPLIVVPSPFLTGGHQLKNAQRLAEAGAALQIAETASGVDAAGLDQAIRGLLANLELRQSLAAKLHGMTVSDAADRLAGLLLKIATRKAS